MKKLLSVILAFFVTAAVPLQAAPEAPPTPGKPAAGENAKPAPAAPDAKTPAATTETKAAQPETKMETITLGAGCFWCVEAVLQRIKGVEKCVSGYSNGKTENPTYRQVCEGDTGHAEVVKVTYNPAVLSTEQLLHIFFDLHDPTTLNRQGADAGTQYRSGIFYHTDAQKEAATKVIAELTEKKKFSSPIVTEVTKAATFYTAEGYHQDYYNLNKDKNRYCSIVIVPKLRKLGLLKDGE